MMVSEVFYWVFNMSITAAVTGSVVILLRLIKRIPRRVICVLWAIPYLRMILPFGINTPFSFMGLLDGMALRAKTVIVPGTELLNSKTVFVPGTAALSTKNSVGAAESYFPIVYKTNALKDVFTVSAFIWLVAVLACFIAAAAVYAATVREIKGAEPSDGVYFSGRVSVPAVYGVFRPRIVLPSFLKGKDNELIILHERTHVKRGDNVWRLLALAVTVVHWFNPLSWIFLKLFLSDLEGACDESVLKVCGEERAKEYALALVGFEEDKNLFASALTGSHVRIRIKNILSYKKMTFLSALGFAALVAAIAVALLTNS